MIGWAGHSKSFRFYSECNERPLECLELGGTSPNFYLSGISVAGCSVGRKGGSRETGE